MNLLIISVLITLLLAAYTAASSDDIQKESREEYIARKNKLMEEQRIQRSKRLNEHAYQKPSKLSEPVNDVTLNPAKKEEELTQNLPLLQSKRDMLLREVFDLEQEMKSKSAQLQGFRYKGSDFYANEGWVNWLLRNAQSYLWMVFDYLSAPPSSPQNEQFVVTELIKPQTASQSLTKNLMSRIVGGGSQGDDAGLWSIVASDEKISTHSGVPNTGINSDKSDEVDIPQHCSQKADYCVCVPTTFLGAVAFAWVTIPRLIFGNDVPTQYSYKCVGFGGASNPPSINSHYRSPNEHPSFILVTPALIGSRISITPLVVKDSITPASKEFDVALVEDQKVRRPLSPQQPTLLQISSKYHQSNSKNPTTGHVVILSVLPAAAVIALWAFLQYGVFLGSVKRLLDDFDKGKEKLVNIEKDKQNRKVARRAEKKAQKKKTQLLLKEKAVKEKNKSQNVSVVSHHRTDTTHTDNPLNSSGRQNSTVASSNMTPLNTSRALGDTSPAIAQAAEDPGNTKNNNKNAGYGIEKKLSKDKLALTTASQQEEDPISRDSTISLARSESSSSENEFDDHESEKVKQHIVHDLSAIFKELLRQNDNAYIHKLSRRLLLICSFAIMFYSYTAVSAVSIIQGGLLHQIFSVIFGKQLVLLIVFGLVGLLFFKTVVELFNGIDYAVRTLNTDAGDDIALPGVKTIQEAKRSRSRSGGKRESPAQIRSRHRSPANRLLK